MVNHKTSLEMALKTCGGAVIHIHQVNDYFSFSVLIAEFWLWSCCCWCCCCCCCCLIRSFWNIVRKSLMMSSKIFLENLSSHLWINPWFCPPGRRCRLCFLELPGALNPFQWFLEWCPRQSAGTPPACGRWWWSRRSGAASWLVCAPWSRLQ